MKLGLKIVPAACRRRGNMALYSDRAFYNSSSLWALHRFWVSDGIAPPLEFSYFSYNNLGRTFLLWRCTPGDVNVNDSFLLNPCVLSYVSPQAARLSKLFLSEKSAVLHLLEGPELKTRNWVAREEKKAQHPARSEPTTSLLRGVRSTGVRSTADVNVNVDLAA